MANTRFGIVNAIGDGVITNGDGIGPARSEVAPRVMERVQNGDRKGFWVAGAPNQDAGFAWEFVFDFGAPRAFTMAAALAVEHSAIAFVEVGVYTSYPSTKAFVVNLLRNGRDWGASFSSVSSQYWYFKLLGTGLVSVAELFLGAVSDLGVIGLHDFTTAPFRVRHEQPQLDGSIVVDDTGRMGHEFEMEFFAKDLTELAKYEALIANPGTLVLLDDRGRCFEVLVLGGRVGIVRKFKGYSVRLQMQRMP